MVLSLALLQPFPLFALSFDPTPAPRPSPSTQPDAAAQKKILQACLNLPLSFEKNEGQVRSAGSGQAVPQVRFLARGRGYSLFLTPAEAVLALSQPKTKSANVGKYEGAVSKLLTPNSSLLTRASDIVRMRVVGGNRLCAMEGQAKLAGKSNYFIGNDRDDWRTGIDQFAKVRMAEVYPGIDMVYYGRQAQLEYDFVVKPGGDPNNIRLKFEGAKSMKVGKDGNLQIKIAGGSLAFQAPVVYQGEGSRKTRVEGRFLQTAKGEVGFEVGAYDASKTLVIDPSLVYSTYLGGSGDDSAAGIVVDGGGNAYVTGSTTGNFPITAGTYQIGFGGGNTDVFVAKLNVSGSMLIYSTYLGGNGTDVGCSIAVNGAGNVYVTGRTDGNFPIVGGVIQTVFGGGGQSAFVTELNPFGSSILYSTYLGGSGGSVGYGIAVDGTGNAYVTGLAGANFPTTAGAYQTVYNGGPFLNGFVAKLNIDASNLIYSTYLGGSGGSAGFGIAVDGAGNACMTGSAGVNFPTTPGAFQPVFSGLVHNAVVAKLNPAGNALVYSTYLGGNGDDYGYGIAMDGSGNAYVTGSTTSPNFPTVAAYQAANAGGVDAFVARLNASGTPVYSTYLGGGGDDYGYGIAVDGSGYAYVTGSTTSVNFPTSVWAYQAANGGGVDAFVTVLTAAGVLDSSTYLGGGGSDTAKGIALDPSRNVYLAGGTNGNFPTTSGAFQTVYGGGNNDAFVAKLYLATPTNTPAPTNTPVPPCNATFKITKNKYSPANDLTPLVINISLCAPGVCTMDVYNTAGEHVVNLKNKIDQSMGADSVTWFGKNDKQAYVASGIYLISFKEPLGIHYARVMIVK